MGIATVASYRGAQLADVTGLSQELLDAHFGGLPSPIAGVGLDELAAAWRAWTEDPEGWFAVLNGEILCRA